MMERKPWHLKPIEIEKLYLGFTKKEWFELAEKCSNRSVKFSIFYSLGVTKCPKCDETFYSSTNFCSYCGFCIREYLANSGLKEVLTNE